VYDDAAAKLGETIRKRLSDQLENDWAAYHDAIAGKQPAPPTSLNVTFDSDQYISSLAAAIETEFGVRPTDGSMSGWESADDLKIVPGISEAVSAQNEPFPEYAADSGVANGAAPPRLAPWQPSPAMSLPAGGGTYFFRLTAVDPSHSAAIEEMRSQITADLQTQAAWSATKSAADQFLNDARLHGLRPAIGAAAVSPSPLLVTGFFGPSGRPGQPVVAIPGYPAKATSAAAVAEAAIKTLIDKAAGKPAIEEAELPDDRKIAIIELAEARPLWTDAAEQAYFQSQTGRELRGQLGLLLQAEWAAPDNAALRTEYKPAQK
jgi:hypothetical protein